MISPIRRFTKWYGHLPVSLQGLGFVALSALLYSLIPISVDLAVNNIAPTVVGIGQIAGYALIHELHRRRLNRKINRMTAGAINASFSDIWHQMRKNETWRQGAVISLGLVTASAFSYIAFGYATVHLDAAIASSMWEFWPMMWLITIAIVDRKRYGPSKPIRRAGSTYALMVAAVFALALVAVSAGTVPDSEITNLRNLGLGLLLAVVGPVLAGLGAAGFLFADRIMYEPRHTGSSDQEAQLRHHWNPESIELGDAEHETYIRNLKSLMVRTSHIFGRTVLFVLVLPFALGEAGIASLVFWKSMFLGVLVGAVLNGPAALGLQEAHVKTERREIIAVQYMSPLLAIVWLAAFSEITISRMDMFLFGTVAVVAINVLINLGPEIIRSEGMPDLRRR